MASLREQTKLPHNFDAFISKFVNDQLEFNTTTFDNTPVIMGRLKKEGPVRTTPASTTIGVVKLFWNGIELTNIYSEAINSGTYHLCLTNYYYCTPQHMLWLICDKDQIKIVVKKYNLLGIQSGNESSGYYKLIPMTP
jgi:hypothetical protein